MIMEITWTHLESVLNSSGPSNSKSSEVPYVQCTLHKPVTGQEPFLAVS